MSGHRVDALHIEDGHVTDYALKRPIYLHFGQKKVRIDPFRVSRLLVLVVLGLALDPCDLAALMRVWIGKSQTGRISRWSEKHVIEVIDDIHKKEPLDMRDIGLIVERITIYEDWLNVTVQVRRGNAPVPGEQGAYRYCIGACP